jgi:hypothetical protein
MRMNIYLPDALAAAVRAELGEANVSGICQAALRAELERTRARAAAGDSSGRIVLFDSDAGHSIAFTGRRVAGDMSAEVYVTPKGGVVVSVPGIGGTSVSIYPGFREFADVEFGSPFLRAVAEALSADNTRELDI